MRYSFHGKVRATGQLVDGYVEAETSTEAIDRLADQGIIGVYSVRAEPKQPRNAVLVAGTPEFDRALYESPDQPRQKRRALPGPSAPMPSQLLPERVPLPPLPAEPQAVAVAAPTAGVSDSAMLQLVDKLSILIGQMQKMLDRPAQVIYASGGPAREGGGKGGKRPSRNINDAQNSTLKDIFQNNLDLRRSLQKLAETVTPAPGGESLAVNGSSEAASGGEPAAAEPLLAEPVSAAADPVAIDGVSLDEGLPLTSDGLADAEFAPPVEVAAEDQGGELLMHVHEDEHHAQPVA